jgi:hypothetical protein
MYFFFDESGDFTFPDDRFNSYVQAALICPDSHLNAVDRFVSARQAAWDVEELHATHLADDQLQDVADFINRSPCQLLAHVVDTVLVTTEQIAEFRLDQAATLSRDLDWYRTESTKLDRSVLGRYDDPGAFRVVFGEREAVVAHEHTFACLSSLDESSERNGFAFQSSSPDWRRGRER